MIYPQDIEGNRMRGYSVIRLPDPGHGIHPGIIRPMIAGEGGGEHRGMEMFMRLTGPFPRMKYEIITGVKREDGIIVLWQDQQQMKSMFFEYRDLIEQRINALDLLDHPKMYRLDPESHTITMNS
jgi:hypothetical protein